MKIDDFDLMTAFDLMPPNCVQHFHPEVHFMDWLVTYVSGRFVIEVGAGMCDFTKTMHRFAIKAMAIEPRATDEVRMECASFLMPKCVQRAGILKDTPALVVVARPDHSGWFGELPDLLHADSELLYIGLPRNFDRDLGGLKYKTCYQEAGADGEIVLKMI